MRFRRSVTKQAARRLSRDSVTKSGNELVLRDSVTQLWRLALQGMRSIDRRARMLGGRQRHKLDLCRVIADH